MTAVTRVTVWNENVHETTQPEIAAIYPHGIHGAVAEALDERGHGSEARVLAEQMSALALNHRFPEYVDPHTGAPRGTLDFSWTAALSLDLSTRLGAR